MIKFSEFDDVLYVAKNMRAKDHAEIFATRNDDIDAHTIAHEIAYFMNGIGFTAYNDDGHAVCVFGAHQRWHKVWDVYMFATDDFNSVATQVTKFVKDKLIAMITDAGAHRCDCMSLSSHKIAHRWLKHLGAVHESTAKKYGKNGEDFYCFAFFKKE